MEQGYLSRDCVNEYFGLQPIRYYEGGEISNGGYNLDDKYFIKIYADESRLTHRMRETDIFSRIISPGIIRNYGFIPGYEIPCSDENLDYVIKTDFVKCEMSNLDITGMLIRFADHLSANIGLAENDYVHRDQKPDVNECSTSNGFKLFDLNNVLLRYYALSREYLDHHPVIWYVFYKLALTALRGTFWNYKSWIKDYQQQIPVYNSIKYGQMENILLDDLLIRLNISNHEIDMYDIPFHPIFKLYNIKYLPPTEVNYDLMEVNLNLDYITPLLWILSSPLLRGSAIFVFEFVDLYYRYLPFVETNEELGEILLTCIRIIEKLNGITFFIGLAYTTPFENISDMVNYTLVNKICKNVGGCLRRRNFYHLARSNSDLLECWKLMFLPYATYMRINGNNFYKLVAPNYNSS